MHSTAAAHTSPVKDGRRILGEKTVNACLSPARHRHTSLSPVKRPLLETPSSPSKTLLPSPLFAGQKRTIDQVDHNEHESTTRERAPVQAPLTPSNAQDELTTESAAAPAVAQIQPDATTQPELPDLETTQQQQQQVEPDQQAQTIPQPIEATQPSQPQEQIELTTTRVVLEDPATRKRFIQEKATLLRSRLQTAMRHVRDPQFDRRLSALEAHSRKCPRLARPEIQAQTPAPKDTLRMTAFETPAPAPFVSTPRILQPAAELHTSPDTTQNNNASGLSSPPLSTGNTASDDPMKTPTQKTYRRAVEGGAGGEGGGGASPMQLSSPPATVSRRRTGPVLEESDREDDGVSLPEKQRRLSQKGDAVDGLLKLMGTAEQQQQQQADTV
ncbi:uncharacterized protein BO97DRAFT_440887 [Aspergillus homomorphus CBS 101889]|uniref:Uncharacterized protein n=1 Tax=Aspergillus homomorphus (strain CBS 101889) TaxID=1450537 RepID=A0A395I5V6_ASPHC|nr:hypothetical protein BO97DRAFT_440887 [Aspergillus homomorphus CBS 101889]RAL15490.1 hypothetical protein BO97DRAFT_440887 [Aspergillus homomorphus CBS 101889]